mmetsp:Transcript_27399/g.46623  ORF Transcript_27399/g.46623 Transcript_27399/m.46623 type:complete len:377 (+) Transcript_27399:134-1264(+)
MILSKQIPSIGPKYNLPHSLNLHSGTLLLFHDIMRRRHTTCPIHGIHRRIQIGPGNHLLRHFRRQRRRIRHSMRIGHIHRRLGQCIPHHIRKVRQRRPPLLSSLVPRLRLVQPPRHFGGRYRHGRQRHLLPPQLLRGQVRRRRLLRLRLALLGAFPPLGVPRRELPLRQTVVPVAFEFRAALVPRLFGIALEGVVSVPLPLATALAGRLALFVVEGAAVGVVGGAGLGGHGRVALAIFLAPLFEEVDVLSGIGGGAVAPVGDVREGRGAEDVHAAGLLFGEDFSHLGCGCCGCGGEERLIHHNRHPIRGLHRRRRCRGSQSHLVVLVRRRPRHIGRRGDGSGVMRVLVLRRMLHGVGLVQLMMMVHVHSDVVEDIS